MRRGLSSLVLLAAACAAGEPELPEVTVLTPEGANHKYSFFSPDGSKVAYWAAGTDGWDLMVAKADLSESRKLASSPIDIESYQVWSPDGQQIAFASAAVSFADVWIVPVAGGAPRRLTDAPGIEFPIWWHAKGDRLAYAASQPGGTFATLVTPVDSNKPVRLVSDPRPGFAIWSRDGSRIAIMMIEGGQWTIWVADGEGNNLRQLTTEGLELLDGWDTPWSPDGKEIVYTSRRTGTGDIWVLPVDSGAPRQLTRDVRNDWQPAWSLDGKWIAFVSDRGRQTDVWVVPAAGGTESRVTDDAAREEGLQWIPNSRKLAFHTGSEISGLWAINLDNGQERRLTPDSLRIGAFDLSPDGAEVVYEVRRGGGVTDLQVQPLGGGPSRALLSDGAINGGPIWSPDGGRILYRSNRTGNFDVWVMDRSGAAPVRLSDFPTDEFNAVWQASGDTVYFTSLYQAKPLYNAWAVSSSGGTPRQLTSTGNVNATFPSRFGPDVFVTGLGERAGQLVLGRVRPDGGVEVLWDRSSVLGHPAIMPGGDSLAIAVEQPGGFGSMLISARSGEGRPILGKLEGAGPFSPDGTRLLYNLGSPTSDLGVMNLRDGSTRRLTETAENEADPRWTPDGKTIVFLRTSERRQIATVDLTRLLGTSNK